MQHASSFIKDKTDVSLAVYDLAGRLVRVPASGKHKAQRHDAVWDGTDSHGQPVAS